MTGQSITPHTPDESCAPDRSFLGPIQQYRPDLYNAIVHDTADGGITGMDTAIRLGLAGKDGTDPSYTLVIHPYWTAHADFMDAWGQRILDDLVNFCLNGQHGDELDCGGLP